MVGLAGALKIVDYGFEAVSDKFVVLSLGAQEPRSDGLVTGIIARKGANV